MPMEYTFLLAGVVLLAIELVIPGFGIFGMAGMACMTIGAFFVLGGGLTALVILLGIYLLFGLVIAFLCLYLPKESKYNTFVLWTQQKNSEGYTGGRDLTALLGQKGRALTTLRPAGTILADGKRLDVSSLGDYVEKGTSVTIVKVEGSKIFVEKTEE